MNYILVTIATILLAFDFAISKKYQALEGTDLPAGLRFNAMNGLCTAVIFFVLSGFQTKFSLYSMVMALLMSLFAMLYSIIGYLKIEQGDAEEALRFNKQALEYDDEDAVFLDNLGQTYYRLLGDKETAKTYFDRAIAIKPGAIDTNYFLALYDIENGDKESARNRLGVARKGFFSPLNYAQPDMIDDKLRELID